MRRRFCAYRYCMPPRCDRSDSAVVTTFIASALAAANKNARNQGGERSATFPVSKKESRASRRLPRRFPRISSRTARRLRQEAKQNPALRTHARTRGIASLVHVPMKRWKQRSMHVFSRDVSAAPGEETQVLKHLSVTCSRTFSAIVACICASMRDMSSCGEEPSIFLF